jgi:phosphopentomutase
LANSPRARNTLTMARAFLFILDSFGIGNAPDAAKFGDEGANTFLHICDSLKLHVPHLASLGLGAAAHEAGGHNPFPDVKVIGRWGHASEVSQGKDTITGHWEIAGVPVPFKWHYYPEIIPAFPTELTDELIRRCALPGLLCCAHASGIQVIEDFGEEHLASGRPIIYTSADSVIQIAAHEKTFGLQRLYEVCKVARDLTYDLKVGRIIARPFIGAATSTFERTGNRKDYAILPPSPTLLKIASDAGRHVISVGKIGDIYGHVGTGEEIKVSGNAAMMDKVVATMPGLRDGGFLMTNFVDFDTLYGHRRDPIGYGKLLEELDASLPRVFARMKDDDLLILTADHGNDPTWKGTDHTREQIPVLTFSKNATPGSIGHRKTFSDIGQSIASHLGLRALQAGTSFIPRA